MQITTGGGAQDHFSVTIVGAGVGVGVGEAVGVGVGVGPAKLLGMLSFSPHPTITSAKSRISVSFTA